MQSRGLITTLAVILIFVSAYQLLFTWKVNQIEKKAVAHAESIVEDDNPERLRLEKNAFLDSISDETVMNMIVKKYTYSDAKKQQLNLGLDLQGGMSVVLQVNIKDFLLTISDDNDDKYFREALNKTEADHSQQGGDFIGMFVRNYQDIHPDGNNARLAPVFTSRDYQEKIPYEATNDEVLEVLRSEAADAIQSTFDIISARIDQFGVTQPNIQLESGRGRIIVELAGVDNPKRVRDLITSTANLELWLTYKVSDIGQGLNEANEVIAEYLDLQETVEGGDETDAVDDLLDDAEDVANEVIDAVEAITDGTEDADDDALDALAGDADTAEGDDLFDDLEGDSINNVLDEEDWTKQFPLFSVLNPNINEQNQYESSPVIGFAQVRDTAKVNEYLALPGVMDVFTDDIRFMWGHKARKFKYDDGTTRSFIDLFAIKTSRNNSDPILDGGVITDASRDLNEYGENYVRMAMNSEGSRTWEKVTGDNVGNHIAIVVDDRVVSAPVIRSKISGGNTSIEGGFTLEEAGDLSSMLRIGKLPARAEIVEEAVVGPTLGKDNIRKGLSSLMWGLLAVVGFMMLYYAGAGVVAVIVLLVNLFLIIGVLASFSATLTLPGIAGLVLTVGMAVDANVIIFERIREELAKGKGLRQSIADGYKYSSSAIIDANITTLLTAIILSMVGHGPVKGFAVILIIGIISSVFTAVLVARVMIETWLGEKRQERTIAFSTPLSKDRFKNLNIDFLGLRKTAYIVSAVLIIAGVASMLTQGFEMGVDFKGGREYKIEFAESVNSSQIKDALDQTLDGGTVVKTFGTANKVKVTTSYLINESGVEVDNTVEESLYTGLTEFIADGKDFETFKSDHLLSRSKVDPIISVDFKRSSVWATVLSISAIFLYILIRFSDFSHGRVKAEYGVGAVVTIAHDVLVVLGVFSIFKSILPFSMEIDQAFIAALLTVIGYSLNDTVVVFDRIREYLNLHPKRGRAEVINQAVNDTLSRTLITSLTTLFVVVILFLFGGSVIKGFAFALLIGIFVGTYSSVFVATPVMYEMSKNRNAKVSKSSTKTTSKKAKTAKA